jgi:F-type H+-transporting ATPase subunit b
MKILRQIAVLAAATAPASVLAAEGGGGLGGLISLAPGSVLWTILTFIILLVVLGKFAWGPIVRGLEEREDRIRTSLEQASRDREEAELRLKEYEEKMRSVSQEVSQRLERADKEAKARIEEAQQTAREESDRMLERARLEIEASREKAAKELRAEVADLAARVASAAIGESFEREDHLRIIRRRLEQVEKRS